jgi:uncharacterized protein
MSARRLPLSTTKDGVMVTVRVTPRARREGIAGITEIADAPGGLCALAVRVAAPPVDGAANQAIVRLLARTCRLPASAFEIVSGDSARVKRILVRGEPGSLLRLLSERLAA